MSNSDEQIRDLLFDGYVSKRLAGLIDTLNHDLYSGPTYLDCEGSPVSCFDDDMDHQLDFGRLCGIVEDWLEQKLPHALYYEQWSGCVLTSEPKAWEDDDGELIEPDPSDYLMYDRAEIVRLICGRELTHHIQI